MRAYTYRHMKQAIGYCMYISKFGSQDIWGKFNFQDMAKMVEANITVEQGNDLGAEYRPSSLLYQQSYSIPKKLFSTEMDL